MMIYIVGYTGDEATGKAFGPVLAFATQAEAEAAVAAIERFDPAEVARGNYFIDGPCPGHLNKDEI